MLRKIDVLMRFVMLFEDVLYAPVGGLLVATYGGLAYGIAYFAGITALLSACTLGSVVTVCFLGGTLATALDVLSDLERGYYALCLFGGAILAAMYLGLALEPFLLCVAFYVVADLTPNLSKAVLIALGMTVASLTASAFLLMGAGFFSLMFSAGLVIASLPVLLLGSAVTLFAQAIMSPATIAATSAAITTLAELGVVALSKAVEMSLVPVFGLPLIAHVALALTMAFLCERFYNYVITPTVEPSGRNRFFEQRAECEVTPETLPDQSEEAGCRIT